MHNDTMAAWLESIWCRVSLSRKKTNFENSASYSGDFSKLGGFGSVGQVIFSLCGTGHPEGFQREWHSKLNSDLIYFLFSIMEYAWDSMALTQKMDFKVPLGVFCVL